MIISLIKFDYEIKNGKIINKHQLKKINFFLFTFASYLSNYTPNCLKQPSTYTHFLYAICRTRYLIFYTENAEVRALTSEGGVEGFSGVLLCFKILRL